MDIKEPFTVTKLMNYYGLEGQKIEEFANNLCDRMADYHVIERYKLMASKYNALNHLCADIKRHRQIHPLD